MGYAAYWRGSKAISEGIARDAYRDGRSWYNPDAPAPKPKPRPADWGDKTAARAADVVARHLRAVRLIAECREHPFTWTQDDEDMAVDNLSERHRIGKSTLRAAFANLKGATMTPEQLVAALTAEIEELRLAIRAEQLQPEGAISPEWVPAFRGYVRMLAPERRMATTANERGQVAWCIERGWTDTSGWHHWTTEWTGRWTSYGQNCQLQEMASGTCANQREAMRAAESMLATYEAPQ